MEDVVDDRTARHLTPRPPDRPTEPEPRLGREHRPAREPFLKPRRVLRVRAVVDDGLARGLGSVAISNWLRARGLWRWSNAPIETLNADFQDGSLAQRTVTVSGLPGDEDHALVVRALQALLGAGAAVEATDNKGLTALHWAALKRHVPALQALQSAGITPLELQAKEGLALINGTQTSTALALHALLSFEPVLEAALVIGALTLDAARGSDGPFDPRIHAVRGQPGQIDVAQYYRATGGNEDAASARLAEIGMPTA